MAQGRVLWLEAKTHDNVSISIVNVHQATANWHDLQQQVTLLLRAMIDAALTQRRIIGGDFNAALSRYGYAQSTSALYDKVDRSFQDFVHSTHGTLIESEAHTRKDLLRGSSRAQAAGLPRQGHVYKTADEPFRFHNKNFDEIRCKLV